MSDVNINYTIHRVVNVILLIQIIKAHIISSQALRHSRLGGRDIIGEGGGLQLLSPGHLGSLLHLVVGQDVLVGGARHGEGVQGVHLSHVPPESLQMRRDLEVSEILSGHPDVLQLGHQLAVEATHGIASQEPAAFLLEVMVDPSELAHERILTGVVLLDQHQLELAVDVLNDPGYFFVLNKEIVASWYGFHDMSLYLLVLEDGDPRVNQDRRWGGVKVGAEVWGRLQHVDGGDLESDGFQLSQ